MSNIKPDPILSLKQVAKRYRRDPKTIWRWWAKEKIFPSPILIGGRCLGWKESVLRNWESDPTTWPKRNRKTN